jgi:WD repeat-containing protein 45
LTDDPSQTAPDYQLIALTFTGGWYRLSLPKVGSSSKQSSGSFSTGLASGSPPKSSLGYHTRSVSGSSTTGRLDKGKEKEKDREEKKDSRNCILQEYRRFGRWDGWG